MAKRSVEFKQILDGDQEAAIIALWMKPPPKGFANWTLRLLAEAAARQIVDLVSDQKSAR